MPVPAIAYPRKRRDEETRPNRAKVLWEAGCIGVSTGEEGESTSDLDSLHLAKPDRDLQAMTVRAGWISCNLSHTIKHRSLQLETVGKRGEIPTRLL